MECTNGTLQILQTICVKCACHILFVAHSQGVADGASLLHTTPQLTTLNVLRPPPSPTARSTMQHERVPHSHSSTDRILSTATASPSRRVGVARKFRRKSGGEAWEDDLLFDTRIDFGQRLRRARNVCVLRAGPRSRCTFSFLTFAAPPSHAAELTPFLPQQEDVQTSFPREDLRRERATHRT